jgi:hypothetical protein
MKKMRTRKQSRRSSESPKRNKPAASGSIFGRQSSFFHFAFVSGATARDAGTVRLSIISSCACSCTQCP